MKCKRKDCMYRVKITENLEICDYVNKTGKARRCRPEQCDKYRKKGRGKRIDQRAAGTD